MVYNERIKEVITMLNVKKEIQMCRILAIAQSIIAPGLLIAGCVLKSNKLKSVGTVLCASIAADTGRAYWLVTSKEWKSTLNALYKEEEA